MMKKNERKHVRDQESDQEKKHIFFLDRFLGRGRVFFLFFSYILYKVSGFEFFAGVVRTERHVCRHLYCASDVFKVTFISLRWSQ